MSEFRKDDVPLDCNDKPYTNHQFIKDAKFFSKETEDGFCSSEVNTFARAVLYFIGHEEPKNPRIMG